jgi:hypothetical protein
MQGAWAIGRADVTRLGAGARRREGEHSRRGVVARESGSAGSAR